MKHLQYGLTLFTGMDVKEIIPFLIVIAFSIVGSLAKKKGGKKPAGKSSKNIFESILSQMEEEMKPESYEPPFMEEQTVVEQEDYSIFETQEDPFLNYERAANKTKPEPVKKTSESAYMHRSEPMNIKKKHKKKKHRYAISNVTEAKKAVVYSEILKPKHF